MTSENSTSPVGDENGQSIGDMGDSGEHSLSPTTEVDIMNEGNTAQGYRQEIENALNVNTSRIGDVFRARLGDEHKSPQTIADELGLGAVNSIYSYLRIIRTLREGVRETDAPTLAAQIASAIRGFVRRHRGQLSPETIARLEALEDDHSRVSNSEQAIARENERIERETEEQEEKGIPGIYVYSYPHYMKYPIIPSEEDDTKSRTYLKVGVSEIDADGRVRQQNVTAVPEPPILLRRYSHPDVDLEEIEGKMHQHLNAADHNRNRQPGAGREWFLTHLTFIDSTAELLGLNTDHAYVEKDEMDG